ncbi:hypothetical protein PVAND_004819 [Polypedilum vanderplanki]|uniref:EGF-like domain-containing protein n=1 Tax=Polypedilum vanderplanki TaxID=319348 RepID=A0A9J6BYQ1_POLVA|nr:hypothetical protein PVAND_004819 [Polypedilum vanderplanki]
MIGLIFDVLSSSLTESLPKSIETFDAYLRNKINKIIDIQLDTSNFFALIDKILLSTSKSTSNMNFLKFILAIFILNCIWFATDACNSSSDDKNSLATTESIDSTTRLRIQIFSKEGCTLHDGSPYCLHGADCYKLISRSGPTCVCFGEWRGHRCNILESNYNPEVDKWDEDPA